MSKILQVNLVSLGLSALLLSGCATFSEPMFDDSTEQQGTAEPRASVTKVETAQSTQQAVSAANPVVEEKTLKSAVDRENSVFFPPDGTTVDAEGRRKLVEHAARLKADPSLSVTLVGHTDDLGSPSYNLAIAEQRVNSVFSILRAQGVPVTQLRRYGMGSEAMGRACRSPECRALMRRVELDYGR